ncbi:MAG: NusG domain II-containing protein [Bacillota bacterium]|jgi:hypothetical protein
MTKGDKMLIALLVLAIALSFVLVRVPAQATGTGQVVVEVGKQEVARFDLEVSGDALLVPIQLPGGVANIEVQGGRVRVLRLPDHMCPNHICSNTGWISRPGQVIVCMPNMMVVTIVGGQEREVDVWS